jgi:hypothetical protein
MRVLAALFIVCGCALAQPFLYGVKGGVPLTDFISAAQSGNVVYTTVPNRYIIGVAGELHLPLGLGVEVDALYRHLNYATNSPPSATTANAWEFPILAKYRFPLPIARPFVDAGLAFDTLQGLSQTLHLGSPTGVNKNTTKGFVIGGGVDVHLLKIHLQPELRFTRWGSQHFLDVIGATVVLQSNQNQAEFLVGIMF